MELGLLLLSQVEDMRLLLRDRRGIDRNKLSVLGSTQSRAQREQQH